MSTNYEDAITVEKLLSEIQLALDSGLITKSSRVIHCSCGFLNYFQIRAVAIDPDTGALLLANDTEEDLTNRYGGKHHEG